MNFSFYIFNYSEGRYDQFPLDETHALFKGFIETREDRAQLTVYRRQRLISYTYIQEYDGVKSCFGFSLVFNGVYCKNIERLFKVFVDAISGEAGNESKLIRYGEEQRKIIFTDEKLYSLLPEIDHFRESVKQEIETMRSDFFPVDTSFDCNNTAEKQLCILDGNEMINAALRMAVTLIT